HTPAGGRRTAGSPRCVRGVHSRPAPRTRLEGLHCAGHLTLPGQYLARRGAGPEDAVAKPPPGLRQQCAPPSGSADGAEPAHNSRTEVQDPLPPPEGAGFEVDPELIAHVVVEPG